VSAELEEEEDVENEEEEVAVFSPAREPTDDEPSS
jgi:hypothetical protein